MLPTVTTASEIGINLAQFWISGSQPLWLLTPQTSIVPPSLAPCSSLCFLLKMIHVYGQRGEQPLLPHLNLLDKLFNYFLY